MVFANNSTLAFTKRPNPKFKKATSIALLIGLSLPCLAQADIYIGMEATDEIIISSNPMDEHDTIRLKELNLEELKLAEPNYQRPVKSTKKIYTQNGTAMPFDNEVQLAAAATTLEPAFIHAVIAVESQHNPRAFSKKGATGLMQLMPATARRFHVVNQYDAHQNIMAGSKYLRELSVLFNGNLRLTLAAYNAGPAAVQKYHGQIPPYAETLSYVPKVLKYYRSFSAKKAG